MPFALVRRMLTHIFAALLVVHGLIHGLGALKAYRPAAVPQLTTPITPARGLLWLFAGLLFIGTAVMLYRWPRWWWAVGLAAVAVSLPLLVAAWRDAWAGALVTLPIVIGLLFGVLVHGPGSLRAQYDDDVQALLAGVGGQPGARLSEDDLAPLPAPVQRYIRRSGAVGQPHVRHFRVRLHGRIRNGPGDPWMPLVAEQHTRVTPAARVFYLRASMRGLPVHGLHRYVGDAATMRVLLAGLVPVTSLSGDEMTRAETVTLLNDLCVMAPGALVVPNIRWMPIDDTRARGTLANAGHEVTAELVFNDAGDLVDFRSDDRSAALPGGAQLVRMPWSTPLTAYGRFGAHRLPSRGEGRWQAPDGEYAYLELEIDDVRYDIAASATPR